MPSPALSLRPWEPADAPAVVAAFAGSDMEEQSTTPIVDARAAEAWIGRHRWYPRGSAFALAVCRADVAVGSVCVADFEPVHGTAWMSYWLAEGARGGGLAARATATLADLVFATGTVFRLELGHRSNNPASGRVAHRAGFLHEGTQRGKLQYGGVRFDTEGWSRLATDPVPEYDPIAVVGPK